MTAQESNALFISVWRLFAESFHNADITTRDGLVISWPDVPLPVYNNIFLTGNIHDPAILAARVSEAALFAFTRMRMSTFSSWKGRRGSCTGTRRSTPRQER